MIAQRQSRYTIKPSKDLEIFTDDKEIRQIQIQTLNQTGTHRKTNRKRPTEDRKSDERNRGSQTDRKKQTDR